VVFSTARLLDLDFKKFSVLAFAAFSLSSKAFFICSAFCRSASNLLRILRIVVAKVINEVRKSLVLYSLFSPYNSPTFLDIGFQDFHVICEFFNLHPSVVYKWFKDLHVALVG